MHRPVVVSLDDGMLTIGNRRSFTDLSDLRATWELLVAGEVVDAGDLEVGDVAASTTVRIAVPCTVPDADDVHLTVRWFQRRATPWSPKSHLVSWDQVPLPTPPTPHPTPKFGADRALSATSAPNLGLGLGFGFGLGAGPELAVFRAPVDNDGLKLLADLGEAFGVGSKTLSRWRDAGIDRLPADELVEHRHEVDTLDDGSQVHVHEVIVPPELDDLARIGVSFELRAGFDTVRWYGRGPLENYPDRNRGALLGTWESGIDESPYLVPQEFGLRTDCRWFEFVSDRRDASPRRARTDGDARLGDQVQRPGSLLGGSRDRSPSTPNARRACRRCPSWPRHGQLRPGCSRPVPDTARGVPVQLPAVGPLID